MFSALFDWLLGAGREAAVFIISMVPLVELRGAVPLGAAAGIPWTTLFPLAILGNMLPIPLLLVFGEKLLEWAETLPPLKKFAAAYKKKLLSKSSEVTKYARLGLYLFVAVPLPGTGAWSGALIATLLKMPKTRALLSIFCGVITAGIIKAIPHNESALVQLCGIPIRKHGTLERGCRVAVLNDFRNDVRRSHGCHRYGLRCARGDCSERWGRRKERR